MIQESIITTLNIDNTIHITPMGVQLTNDGLVLAPFKPSITLDNLLRTREAIINYTTDTRIFAGCLTGRYDWSMQKAIKVKGKYLTSSLTHAEVNIHSHQDDSLRPRLVCKVVHTITHKPFNGFNRAQAAVIELAIITSRLDRLPQEKIDNEIAYLQIAIDKTAGEHELIAWNWLIEKIKTYQGEK